MKRFKGVDCQSAAHLVHWARAGRSHFRFGRGYGLYANEHQPRNVARSDSKVSPRSTKEQRPTRVGNN